MGELGFENVNFDKSKAAPLLWSLYSRLWYMSSKWFWCVQTWTACGDGFFIWNFFSSRDKDDWVAWSLQSQEARITASQPGTATYSEQPQNAGIVSDGHCIAIVWGREDARFLRSWRSLLQKGTATSLAWDSETPEGLRVMCLTSPST